MSKLRIVVLFSISIVIFIASMGLNILAHEAGHYIVADSYGLSPELHFNGNAPYSRAFWSADSDLASVSYSSEYRGIVAQDFWIAFAGPLVNLFLFCLFFVAYRRTDRKAVKLFLVSPVVISFVSFIANITPTAPSDGFILFSYLL